MTRMLTAAPRGRDDRKPIPVDSKECAARNEPSRWKGGCSGRAQPEQYHAVEGAALVWGTRRRSSQRGVSLVGHGFELAHAG